MRKTRILAALLCIMMIATAIPVLQVSANSSVATYTLEQALEGAEQVYTAVFADDAYTAITGTTYYYDTNEKYVKWREAGYSNDIIRESDGGRLARLCDNEGGYVTPVGLVKSRHNSNADANAFCRAEMQLADGSLTGQQADGNYRLLVVDMTEEGLAIRAGNDATGNSNNTTPAGGSGEGAGWSWDNTNANTNYGFLDGKLDVDTGYAGAMLFKLKLTEAGSVAEVKLTDGANGQVSVGFKLSDAGIQMINASNFAYGDETISADYVAAGDTSAAGKYPLAVDTWYEILLKNNYNRYTIYAKEADAEGFTKVVTGTPVGAAMPNGDKKLSINAYYNSNGLKATEKVTINGVTKEYYADQYDTGDEGVTSIVAGNGSRALSEVVVESITTYKDSVESGLSVQDVLGDNAFAVTKMDFDSADAKQQLDEGKPLFYWGVSSAAGTRNAEGNLVLDAQAQIDMGVLSPNMGVNQAFEISYLMPATETTAKLGLRGGLSTDIGGRLYADLDADVNRQMAFYSREKSLVLYNNKDLTAERTLLVNPAGNGVIEYYMKNPVSGKYLFIGKAIANSGSLSGFYLKNSTAAGQEAKADYTVTGFAVYQKTGTLNTSELLPGDASVMRQYVNEDFTAVDEINYQPYNYAGEGFEGGSSCVEGMLAVARPTYNADKADQCAFFDLNDAGIPKGGYANIRFRSTAGRGFRVINSDGETDYTVNIGCDTQALRVTPDATYDLRITRSVEGNYTIYLKRVEDAAWTKVVDDAAPTASTSGKNRLRFGGYQFNANATYSYATSNATAIDYIDSVTIYGPAGSQEMLILDDNDNTQTTVVPVSGAKLNYGIKAIVAPGEKKQLIFAGYDAEMNLIAAEPVTVEASENETVKMPTLTDSRIEIIKVFLWDNFEKLTSLTPAVEFTAPE